MITQETKPIKTQGGFNLVILKVKPESIMKESKLFNRIQTTNILLLPTSRNLLTRPCAISETTNSFFLEFSSKYKHTRLCIFKLLVQQLNDHQALNEISFLIILSMCEGNHLQISQEIHTHSKIEQPQKGGQSLPLIHRAKHKTLTF